MAKHQIVLFIYLFMIFVHEVLAVMWMPHISCNVWISYIFDQLRRKPAVVKFVSNFQ